MTGVADSVRDYAHNHPMAVAAGVIIAIPGAYLYITGKSITCAVGLCKDAPSPLHSPMASITRGLSVYDPDHPLDLRLNLPISRWSDKPSPAFIMQALQDTTKNTVSFLTSSGQRLRLDLQHFHRILEDRWALRFPPSQPVSPRLVYVALATALPGAFFIFTQQHPGSWATRHQAKIANALHLFALVTVANQKISAADMVVAALVMISFEALQRIMRHDSGNGEAPPAIETLLSQTHLVVAKSDIVAAPEVRDGLDHDEQGNGLTLKSPIREPKDEEIVRLQKTLTEVKTAEKAKEHDLKRTRVELHNARETLNETFAEYTNLRDEMKAVKQTVGRDHQAIIYRKDIELFALRKANEQKENYIKERDLKLEDIYRQQKATLEVKDSQIRNLKERVAFLERKDSPKFNDDVKVDSAVDGDQAVQVKMLRIKGRSSLDVERAIEEKDAEIARLKLDLSHAFSANEALEKTQDELRRAWDASLEAQSALNEERQQHAATQSKLQEAALRLNDEHNRSQKSSPTTRLPTIEEQDKRELEAMFNAAQQDNLRLYTEVEALDKRVRDANAKLFTSEQEAEALREQLRLERAITEDMETARPSLVHRVHFQRMEGQLKESREALDAKDDEIEQLKKRATELDGKLEELRTERATDVITRKELHEENSRLKQSIEELESTKEQLMLDHERLARHRARQRQSSGTDHTSARSSGATLITDPPVIITNSEEPMPARPVSIAPDRSIQSTPERHLRSDTNRVSLISNDVPPPELRTVKKKSLGLKELIRKFGGSKKDNEGDDGAGREKEKERPKTAKETKKAEQERARTVKEVKKEEKERPKTALMPKDKNAMLRPKTATPAPAENSGTKEVDRKVGKEVKEEIRPKTAGPANKIEKENRPKTAATPSKESKRYYSTQTDADARPKTAGVPVGKGKGKENVDVVESPRPKSKGWGSTRKLVRKSVA